MQDIQSVTLSAHMVTPWVGPCGRVKEQSLLRVLMLFLCYFTRISHVLVYWFSYSVKHGFFCSCCVPLLTLCICDHLDVSHYRQVANQPRCRTMMARLWTSTCHASGESLPSLVPAPTPASTQAPATTPSLLLPFLFIVGALVSMLHRGVWHSSRTRTSFPTPHPLF